MARIHEDIAGMTTICQIVDRQQALPAVTQRGFPAVVETIVVDDKPVGTGIDRSGADLRIELCRRARLDVEHAQIMRTDSQRVGDDGVRASCEKGNVSTRRGDAVS